MGPGEPPVAAPVTCPPRGLLSAPGGGRPGPGPLLWHLLGDCHDPGWSGGGRPGCRSVLGLSGADGAAPLGGAGAAAAQRGARAVGRAPQLQPQPFSRPPSPGDAARSITPPLPARTPQRHRAPSGPEPSARPGLRPRPLRPQGSRRQRRVGERRAPPRLPVRPMRVRGRRCCRGQPLSSHPHPAGRKTGTRRMKKEGRKEGDGR